MTDLLYDGAVGYQAAHCWPGTRAVLIASHTMGDGSGRQKVMLNGP